MSNALGAAPKPHEDADSAPAARPDRVILVYDGDSGIRAMLLDVIKKAVGREDCPLCEIVYSPVGKRREWVECAARLQVPVAEMHRDELPAEWGVERMQLPCVLAQTGQEKPTILVTRREIAACQGEIGLLENQIRTALDAVARKVP